MYKAKEERKGKGLILIDLVEFIANIIVNKKKHLETRSKYSKTKSLDNTSSVESNLLLKLIVLIRFLDTKMFFLYNCICFVFLHHAKVIQICFCIS